MRLKFNRTNIKKLEPRANRYEVTDAETTALRLRITPAGIKTFVLVYRNAEHQLKRFTIGKFGDLTPEQAREIAEKKLAEVKLGKDPATEKQEIRQQAKREQYMTLEGFLERKYGPWVETNRKSGKETLRMLRSRFADLLDKRLDEISPWIVEKWRKARIEDGKATSTINRNLTALKACLSAAVDWGLLEVHPLTRLKLGKEDCNAGVRYLSQEEEKRLRAALMARDDRIKTGRDSNNAWREDRGITPLPSLSPATYGDHLSPMVLLSINTGMRRGEVFNLKWPDVNFDTNTAAIRGMRRINESSSKSGSTRHLPLNAEALDALRKWHGQLGNTSGLVFPSKDGKPFNNVKKAWAGLLVDAKITGFRWHDMRHHFASRLVMAGVDLNTVRELLGHSDIKMTLRYAHLAPEHKAAAVAKLVEG